MVISAITALTDANEANANEVNEANEEIKANNTNQESSTISHNNLPTPIEGLSKKKALTVLLNEYQPYTSEERHFLYSNHLSKKFLEQMIPHLKAII